MSDTPEADRIPPMAPDKARDVGRAYKALAEHLADLGAQREAGRAERDSQWWLAYANSLGAITTRDVDDAMAAVDNARATLLADMASFRADIRAAFADLRPMLFTLRGGVR